MSSVSIIIVSWNTASFLKACLSSVKREIKAAGVGPIEVVVIDNASIDGSQQMVEGEFPEVKLLKNSENVGFAQANNQGFSTSQSDFVWMLNPDTELGAGALRHLVGFMEAHPEAGAAGSLLHDDEGELEQAAFPIPSPWRELWRLFYLEHILPIASYPLDTWAKDQGHQVGAVQGASMMLRKEALDEVGGLDTDYFLYTEEVDLCYRMSLAGWKIYWVPFSRVLHHGGQSTRQVAIESFLNLYRSKIQFMRKHYGPVMVLAYKGILLMAALPRVLAGLVFRMLASEDEERVALANNYLSLVRALPSY